MDVPGCVTAVTERTLDMGDTPFVNMVRRASKKAFFEPGDTSLQRKGEAAANFVCKGIASGYALPTSSADHWYPTFCLGINHETPRPGQLPASRNNSNKSGRRNA
jgi:hypothetical protein